MKEENSNNKELIENKEKLRKELTKEMSIRESSLKSMEKGIENLKINENIMRNELSIKENDIKISQNR